MEELAQRRLSVRATEYCSSRRGRGGRGGGYRLTAPGMGKGLLHFSPPNGQINVRFPVYCKSTTTVEGDGEFLTETRGQTFTAFTAPSHFPGGMLLLSLLAYR